MAAKAYRLLRAVLMTAVEEDKILTRNPCAVRGAGNEQAAERPTLTVAQIFELADRVGLRPVGNLRKLDTGEYRLRFYRWREIGRAPSGMKLPNGEIRIWGSGLTNWLDSLREVAA